MTPRPLTGPDAQIYDFLAHVVAIGKRRGAWDETTVARVAAEHLAPKVRPRPPARRPPPPKPRTRIIQRYQPPTGGEPRTVTLPPGQARVLAELVNHPGELHVQIATRLHISKSSMSNFVGRVVHNVGARTATEAVALVLTGQVIVETATRKRAA